MRTAANLFDKSFRRDDLVECGCNTHARRYFNKALDAGDKRVAVVLAAFKKLYKIERQIHGRPPDEILAVRLEKSRPIYDKLVQWCEAHQPHVEPRSKTGAAIRYLLNHKDALQRFLEHGLIPIDNGAVERLHIRVALTRKNFLFAGSDAGAQRAAIAYSILGCCALADVDPASAGRRSRRDHRQRLWVPIPCYLLYTLEIIDETPRLGVHTAIWHVIADG